jgi:hypothetical protein
MKSVKRSIVTNGNVDSVDRFTSSVLQSHKNDKCRASKQ